jgi:probable rRNA maturation factor
MTERRKSNAVLLDIRGAGRGGSAEGRFLKRLAVRFLRELDLSGVELSLSLIGDREMRELNRSWRGKHTPTDVLSFPADTPSYLESATRRVLGDVVISLETARRARRLHETTLRNELALYLAHGLLHLLGHDHLRRAEARRMAREEDRLLRGAGMLARSDEGP